MTSGADWPEVALGEVCEFKYGKSLPAARRKPGAFPVYGSNGVVGEHSEALTSGPTIIVGRKGSFGEVNYSYSACWPIDTTYFVDAASTKVDLRWLAHLLPTLRLTELNRAAAVPGLNREDAYRRRLFLPTSAEQRRIAGILDQADALRAKRREALAHLDELTQSIFLDMFGDPMTNSMNWPRKAIRDWGQVTTGSTPPRTDESNYGPGIEWIKSDNLNSKDVIATRAVETLSQRGKSLARRVGPGSILVTCIAGSPGSIGNAAITDREVAFNQQINALTPDPANSRFLLAQLVAGKALVQERSSGGMKGLVSKSRFGTVLLMAPPAEIREEFGRRTAGADRLTWVQKGQLAELEALFASLQSRAFAGEL